MIELKVIDHHDHGYVVENLAYPTRRTDAATDLESESEDSWTSFIVPAPEVWNYNVGVVTFKNYDEVEAWSETPTHNSVVATGLTEVEAKEKALSICAWYSADYMDTYKAIPKKYRKKKLAFGVKKLKTYLRADEIEHYRKTLPKYGADVILVYYVMLRKNDTWHYCAYSKHQEDKFRDSDKHFAAVKL